MKSDSSPAARPGDRRAAADPHLAPGGQSARSRFAPRPRAGLVLEARDEALLRDLFRLRVLSRQQVQRLHYGSVSRCNRRLRQLFDGGYVARHFPPAAPHNAQALYTLGPQSLPRVRERLAADGLEVTEEDLRVQSRRPALSLLEHALAIGDVYVALCLALRDDPAAALARWVPERLGWQEFEIRRAAGGGGGGAGRWRREVFAPDAVFALRCPSEDRHGTEVAPRWFVLEVDRGHVNARQFRGKARVHRHVREAGLFGRLYGAAAFETLVVTTGERRLANLWALARAEGGSHFRLTTFARLAAGPLGPIWSQASPDERACLL